MSQRFLLATSGARRASLPRPRIDVGNDMLAIAAKCCGRRLLHSHGVGDWLKATPARGRQHLFQVHNNVLQTLTFFTF